MSSASHDWRRHAVASLSPCHVLHVAQLPSRASCSAGCSEQALGPCAGSRGSCRSMPRASLRCASCCVPTTARQSQVLCCSCVCQYTDSTECALHVLAISMCHALLQLEHKPGCMWVTDGSVHIVLAAGAHNTIVTSRAGKDLVSCLVSGLLTIGPRFGGAIDDAARNFKSACDQVGGCWHVLRWPKICYCMSKQTYALCICLLTVHKGRCHAVLGSSSPRLWCEVSETLLRSA